MRVAGHSPDLNLLLFFIFKTWGVGWGVRIKLATVQMTAYASEKLFLAAHIF